MATSNNSDLELDQKPEVIYRCKKCRRIVASQEHIVLHERGKGQKCFKWKKRSSDPWEMDKEPPQCSSIFVEPLKWMETGQLKPYHRTFLYKHLKPVLVFHDIEFDGVYLQFCKAFNLEVVH